MVSETGSDPFSASEEAFFQAAELALPSDAPVTFDEELVEEPLVPASARSAEREARRARFVRPVRSTLAVLSALTLVGLARFELRADPLESARRSEESPIAGAQTASPTDVAFEPAAESASLFTSRGDGPSQSDAVVPSAPSEQLGAPATGTSPVTATRARRSVGRR